MGFFGGHDAGCHCRSCGATPRGGRDARPAKVDKATQRRHEVYKAKQARAAENAKKWWH